MIPITRRCIIGDYYLGPMCSKSHEFEKTGKSMRSSSGGCVECGKTATDIKKIERRKHKKTNKGGVSMLEQWLHVVLPIFYPNIEFHFNRRDRIGLEPRYLYTRSIPCF